MEPLLETPERCTGNPTATVGCGRPHTVLHTHSQSLEHSWTQAASRVLSWLLPACRGVKKYGGEVKLKSHVQQVLLEKGRAAGVVLKSGQVIKASKVWFSASNRWFLA